MSIKTNILIICAISLLATYLTSCFISGGTHGSLEEYQYPTTKVNLEKALLNIIESNPNITRQSDTAFDQYYNERGYLTLTIKKDSAENEYVIRFYGDSLYWETAKVSELFICYAYDKYRNGGSEGNGGVRRKVLRPLLEVFESEIIRKIDSSLNLTHTDPK